MRERRIALNLKRNAINAVRDALPPLDEQRAIAAYLDAETAHIDAVIERTRAGIALLHEYRTALISAAVTGQIDGYSTVKKA